MSDQLHPQELLDAYLDGELDASEQARVDAALADSPSLAAELAERAVVRAQLRDLPMVDPPDGFFEAMLERGTADPAAVLPPNVASLSGARVAKGSRRSLGSHLSRAVAVAAVFLLVLGFGSGFSAIERVPALDAFANRHAEALEAMAAGEPDGASTDEFHPMPMDEVKDLGPATMDMMGAYENDDKVLQLIYADGDGGMISVFRQDGFVKSDDMPEAETMEMAGDEAWHLQQGDFDTLVVDRDGITYTLMGSLSSGPAMESLASDLPETESGWLDRVRNTSRGLLETIGLR